MTPYRPQFVAQLDGSKYAGLNCTPTSGAVALDRETLGKRKTTGAIVRSITGDTSGGTNLNQIDAALSQGWDVDLDTVLGISTSAALSRLDEGRGMMLQGQEGATHGTKWSASETFTGNHCWFDNERRKNSQVPGGYEHLIYDPLADGRRLAIALSPMWIPETVVLDFARRLNLASSGYIALGYGRLYASFTHDTEPHLTLRYSAKAITPPSRKTVKVPAGRRANVRNAPSINGAIVQRLANGNHFTAYQVTTKVVTKGQTVGGSSTWYGNIDGTRWAHMSAF
jgi:hypothetical protein